MDKGDSPLEINMNELRHDVKFASVKCSSARDNVEITKLRMCDLNNKISQTDHELSTWRSKVQEFKRKHELFEENLTRVKLMQEKALAVRKMDEKKFKMLHEQMAEIHRTYLTVTTCKTEPESNEVFDEVISARVKDLTKDGNQLRQKLTEMKDLTEKDVIKLTEINMQITIQKTKNDALLLKLRRQLDNSKKQEEAAIARLNDL